MTATDQHAVVDAPLRLDDATGYRRYHVGLWSMRLQWDGWGAALGGEGGERATNVHREHLYEVADALVAPPGTRWRSPADAYGRSSEVQVDPDGVAVVTEHAHARGFESRSWSTPVAAGARAALAEDLRHVANASDTRPPRTMRRLPLAADPLPLGQRLFDPRR